MVCLGTTLPGHRVRTGPYQVLVFDDDKDDFRLQCLKQTVDDSAYLIIRIPDKLERDLVRLDPAA